MAEFEHEKIMGAKVYFGKGITDKEKEEIKKWIEKRPHAVDTHFWKSDGKIKFQQLVGKEYFGWVFEAESAKDIAEGKFRQVI